VCARLALGLSVILSAMPRAYAASPLSGATSTPTSSGRQPTEAEIEDAARMQRMPTAAEVEAATSSTPKLNAIPSGAPLDIEALARALQEPSADLKSSIDTRRLRIFVTLAMPEATLRALTTQALRTSATLVLRGAKNGSIRQTLEAVRDLIGAQPVAWEIDPPAFARYDITLVPSFVLSTGNPLAGSCEPQTCASNGDFAKVAGDVSLDYALEAIARGAPHLAADASAFLTRLRGER
jgi:conjugal transfer pilus assembly protein TrbC